MAVQAQWEISNTIFNGGAMLRQLISASSMDDVQGQAVLAFEGLGTGILVDPDRVSEAVDALGGRHSERLNHIKLVAGLSGDGLPRLLRKSTACIASFVLAMACKTCYEDTEIANIFFEMMVAQGILVKCPVSAWQLGQLITAVSGYGDSLIPIDVFSEVVSRVQPNLSDSLEMPGLFSKMEPKPIASLLSHIFAALQNMNISRIIVEGNHCGLWLATVLLWLDPNVLQLSVHSTIIFGDPSARMAVRFCNRDDPSWKIQAWTAEKQLPDIIVPSQPAVGDGDLNLPLNVFPQISAKQMLASQFRLTPEYVTLAGQLAGALITMAFEFGSIVSQENLGSDPHSLVLPRVTQDAGLPRVRLSELCQEDFLESYNHVVRRFRWAVDKQFSTGQAEMANAIRTFLKRTSEGEIDKLEERSKYLQNLENILSHVEAESSDSESLFQNIGHSNILEPAIYVVAQAISTCLCRKFPRTRFSRGYSYNRTQKYAHMIWRIIFRPTYGIYGFSIADLRAETYAAMLPGVKKVESHDLILTANGYLAYMSALQNPSTSRRDCCAICVLPRTIRWGVHNTQFISLRESPAEDFPAHRQFFSSNEPLHVFHNGTYSGFDPLADPDDYKIETLLSTSDRVLLLETHMKSPRPECPWIGLEWTSSMDAVAFATPLEDEHGMTSSGEELLAKEWHQKQIFGGVAWLRPGGNTSGSNYKGYICMTLDDELLRFFAAGRFRRHKLYVRRGAALIQGMKKAMEMNPLKQNLAMRLGEYGHDFQAPTWVIIA